MDKTASAYQVLLRYFGECGEVPDLDRRLRICARRYLEEATKALSLSLRNPTNPESHDV